MFRIQHFVFIPTIFCLTVLCAPKTQSESWKPVTNFGRESRIELIRAGDWFFLQNEEGTSISSDGKTWEPTLIINDPTNTISTPVTCRNGIYISRTKSDNVVARSTNGRLWTALNVDFSAQEILGANNTFSIYDRFGRRFESLDGVKWTLAESLPFEGSLIDVISMDDESLLALENPLSEQIVRVWQRVAGEWKERKSFSTSLFSTEYFEQRIDGIALVINSFNPVGMGNSSYSQSISTDGINWPDPSSAGLAVPFGPEIIFQGREIRSDASKITTEVRDSIVTTPILGTRSFAASDDTIVATTDDGGIYRSEDGISWNAIIEPAPFATGPLITPEAIIFYGGRGAEPWRQDDLWKDRSFFSNDGENWQSIDVPENVIIVSLQSEGDTIWGKAHLNPSLANTHEELFVLKEPDDEWLFKPIEKNSSSVIRFNGLYYYSSERGIFRSEDGEEWMPTFSDEQEFGTHLRIQNSNLYLLPFVGDNATLVSTDGENWQVLNPPAFAPKSIEVGGYLYAYTSDGLALSKDNGYTWIDIFAPSKHSSIKISGTTVIAEDLSRDEDGSYRNLVYHFNAQALNWIEYSIENKNEPIGATARTPRGDFVGKIIGMNRIVYVTADGETGEVEFQVETGSLQIADEAFYLINPLTQSYLSQNGKDWEPTNAIDFETLEQQFEFKGSLYTTGADRAGNVFQLSDSIGKEKTRLNNVSNRASGGTGDETVISGFVIEGSGSVDLLIRAVGPSLDRFGISTPSHNPSLSLYTSTRLIEENDDWGSFVPSEELGSLTQKTNAFPLSESPKRGDAALAVQLRHGVYSAISNSNDNGIILSEIYSTDFSSDASVVNISTRAKASGGEATAILGFSISGSDPANILIRAAGPALAPLGVSNPLSDPIIYLFKEQTLHYQNDNWSHAREVERISPAEQNTGAFPFTPNSKDAAMLVTLPPGIYTVHVQSKDESEGIVLLEAYLVEPEGAN